MFFRPTVLLVLALCYIGIMAMRYIAVTYPEDKEVNTTACTRLFSLGCAAHTDIRCAPGRDDLLRRGRDDDQLLRRDRQHGTGGDRRDR